jgi:hypothetical protein
MAGYRLAGYILALIVLLSGCDDKKGKNMSESERIKLANLAFTCALESDHLPPVEPQADLWFKQARAMQVAPGEKNFDAIAGLYRRAASEDHYKAMINLQNLLRRGQAHPVAGQSAPEEVISLTEQMMKLNIPAGYYLMGHYMETGYGVKRDKTSALAYFRKAADLGNPEAQNYLGKLFITEQVEDSTDPKTLKVSFKKNPVFNPEIGKSMLDCAANQGNGGAAYYLAIWLSIRNEDYTNALHYYQLGVKNGHDLSIIALIAAFNAPEPNNRGHYLNVKKDPERMKRYTLIEKEMDQNPSARFPDIDKIVPLPPAELPEWDGSFEYKKGDTEK